MRNSSKITALFLSLALCVVPALSGAAPYVVGAARQHPSVREQVGRSVGLTIGWPLKVVSKIVPANAKTSMDGALFSGLVLTALFATITVPVGVVRGLGHAGYVRARDAVRDAVTRRAGN